MHPAVAALDIILNTAFGLRNKKKAAAAEKKKKEDTGAYLHVCSSHDFGTRLSASSGIGIHHMGRGGQKKARQTRICTPGIEEDDFVHCFLNCQGTVRHLWTSSVPSNYSGGARKRL